MKNRYGDEYRFEQIDEDTYKLSGELKYWRFGGKEGQDNIDLADLGMADPSGGPFIELGMKLFGRTITNIRAENVTDKECDLYLEVQ